MDLVTQSENIDGIVPCRSPLLGNLGAQLWNLCQCPASSTIQVELILRALHRDQAAQNPHLTVASIDFSFACPKVHPVASERTDSGQPRPLPPRVVESRLASPIVVCNVCLLRPALL